MKRPSGTVRVWANERPQRRASVLELLLFTALTAACFAGAVAAIVSLSMRELAFVRQAGKPGASLEVTWRYAGLRVWQARWPEITSADGRYIAIRHDDGANPIERTPDLEGAIDFRDGTGRTVLTFRDTSLHGDAGEIEAWLTAAPAPSETLTIAETRRWWSYHPWSEFFWMTLAAVVALVTGCFFLVGTVSAGWVRLTR